MVIASTAAILLLQVVLQFVLGFFLFFVMKMFVLLRKV